MSSSDPLPNRLSLPENLTVRNAGDVKDQILLSLAGHPSTELAIPDGSTVDLSFVQMVEAGRVHADHSGKRLSLSRGADGALLGVLDRGGFMDGMSADDKQFWLHQGETQ
ncbi:MAG: STAS domain-containing protein [Pseudorhizobium sp.]